MLLRCLISLYMSHEQVALFVTCELCIAEMSHLLATFCRDVSSHKQAALICLFVTCELCVAEMSHLLATFC